MNNSGQAIETVPAHAPQGAKGVDKDTLRDQALAVVPVARHALLLTSAIEAGITDAQDPQWWWVATSVNIAAATEQVGQSADRVRDELASIPSSIQKAVIAGGEDIQGLMNQTSTRFVATAIAAIQKAIEQSSLEASTKLWDDTEKAAASIKDVVGSLPSAIILQRDAAVKEYAVSGATAAQAAVAATKWRGKAWAGFSFLTVLLVGGVLGGYVTVTGGEILHKIQPVAYSVLIKNAPDAHGFGVRPVPGNPDLIQVYPKN